jgi:long-chain acyl-CoA synthetase
MPIDSFWKKSWDPGLADLDPKVFETTCGEVFRSAFQLFPEKVALCFMGTEVTFAELDRHANRFANLLIANGLKKGDLVGINLPNIPEYVVAWLGALRAGCVVSGVSPLLSPEELLFQLKDSNARALVTLDAIFEKRLAAIASQLPELRLVVAASVGGFLPGIKRVLGKLLRKIPSGRVTPLPGKTVLAMPAVLTPGAYPDSDPMVRCTPDDVAYIQYTGGTTGSPKGAVLTHRNAVSDLLILQAWLGWQRGDGLALSGFPFFHIAGLCFLQNCIFLGWTEVLIPNPRDTDHICREIKKYRPTVLANVPSLYQLLIANPKFGALDHSRLEAIISAAAPFPEESQRMLEGIVGKGKLVEAYGMSETSPLTVGNPVKGPKKLGTIGLPLLNTQIKLCDPFTGRQVAPGEPGEICIKGPQVMIGYHNKPEETRQVIDAEGYLHSGDVAVQDPDGYLRIVDRTKDMIIVGGFKVFSKRVEEILVEHPAINMVALIGTPNPERPGSELVAAFVVPRAGRPAGEDPEALRQDILKFARQRLAPYEIPKQIEFRTELPLTAVGKVDKKRLRAEMKG